MIPAWVRVIVEALRDYYHPTRHSFLIKNFPAPRHIEIERGAAIIKKLSERWILQIPPLSVDSADRIAMMQYTVRTLMKPFNDAKATDPSAFLKIAKLKMSYYDTVILFLYDLSKGFYKSFWDRRDYKKFLFQHFRNNIPDCLKTFDDMMEYNSNLESFFFEIPPINRRAFQRPGRDGWRTIRGGVWNEGWGDLLKTPILKIYSQIIYSLENDLLADMEEAQRKMEDGFNKGH